MSVTVDTLCPPFSQFKFHGAVSRYLEDLVVQIGAPLLNQPVLDESRVWRRSDSILLVIIIVFPSAFPSLHHRWTSATSLATRNREKPVTATFTAVKNGSESPLIPGNRAIYHSSPARTTPGKNDRSVTHPAENRMRIIEYPKPCINYLPPLLVGAMWRVNSTTFVANNASLVDLVTSRWYD
ncbi:hypothetical protein BGY98DRAFT_1000667, partial [Russula aff. rugulosa BPL654]